MLNLHSIKKNIGSTPFTIYAIFEKDPPSEYTPDALLYQDILSYIFADRPDRSFTYHMLAEWLLNVKNQEYKIFYSGSKAKTSTWNKIQGTRRRIEKFVQNLVNSGYMQIVGQTKSPRNDIQMPLYRYSILGQMLALILEYGKTTMNDKKKENLCDLLFEIIQKYFKLYNSYIGDFLASFYKKIFDKGYKMSMAEYLFRILEQSGNGKISSLIDAFNWSLFLQLEKNPNRQAFTEIFIETLNDLPEAAKKAVMLHDKTTIELRILQDTPSKEWSDLWVSNISDTSKLTLYACCTSCNRIYAAVIDYIDYIQKSEEGGMMKGDCLFCPAKQKTAYVNQIILYDDRARQG